MSGPGRGQYDRTTSESDPFTTQDLARRVNNIVRYGTIEKIDHKKGRARIKIGPLSSAWIPWHTAHAGKDVTWAPPSAGEQVTVFCPGGNLNQAVMLGGLYRDKFKSPSQDKNERVHKLKDGTTITHNVEKKTRVTKMPDEGSHKIQVNKQEQQVDKDGTRLVNDKGTVRLDTNGKITKKNQGGSIEIDPGGTITQKASSAISQTAPKQNIGGGMLFLNC